MTVKTTTRQRKKKSTNNTEPKQSTNKVETKNGIIPILKSIFFYVLCFVAILLTVFIYGCVTSPVKAVSFKEEDMILMVEKTGILRENKRLTKGTKIFHPEPESIAEDESGNLYTGLKNGNIVKIAPSRDGVIGAGPAVILTSGVIEGVTCLNDKENRGRPLGLRIHGNQLYVADSLYGIYKVDLKTKKVKILVSSKDASPPISFPNDLTVSKDGKVIYFTDVSIKYGFMSGILNLMTGLCDSRVFKYDIATKKVTAVLFGLCTANGIQLSEDESKLLVAEVSRSRVKIYDTKTWKITKIVNFPALPDNIRKNSKGTYWVATSVYLSKMNMFLDRNPMVRQAIAGLFSDYTILNSVKREANALFEIDDDGEILQSLYDPDGDLTFGLSQATELSDGRLALGSYTANFMSFLNLEDSKPIGRKNH